CVMGFRAIEIDAMLRAAQLERERHPRASAANLASGTAHRTPRRHRLKTAFRALGAPRRRANGAARFADTSRRRAFLPWRAVVTGLLALAALAAAVWLAACATASAHRETGGQADLVSQSIPATAGRRPNIVFVLTDDLSMDLLRYMPQVKALERRGMTFH